MIYARFAFSETSLSLAQKFVNSLYDACEDYACKDFTRGGEECNTTPFLAIRSPFLGSLTINPFWIYYIENNGRCVADNTPARVAGSLFWYKIQKNEEKCYRIRETHFYPRFDKSQGYRNIMFNKKLKWTTTTTTKSIQKDSF